MTQTDDQSQPETSLDEETPLKVGVFIAIMSENDVATPFWIAQVISLPGESASGSQEIGVRWFQASGCASDPYDAQYTPAVRKRDKDGTVLYWETPVSSSQVIYIFQALTSENRINMENAHVIKGLIYQ